MKRCAPDDPDDELAGVIAAVARLDPHRHRIVLVCGATDTGRLRIVTNCCSQCAAALAQDGAEELDEARESLPCADCMLDPTTH